MRTGIPGIKSSKKEGKRKQIKKKFAFLINFPKFLIRVMGLNVQCLWQISCLIHIFMIVDFRYLHWNSFNFTEEFNFKCQCFSQSLLFPFATVVIPNVVCTCAFICWRLSFVVLDGWRAFLLSVVVLYPSISLRFSDCLKLSFWQVHCHASLNKAHWLYIYFRLVWYLHHNFLILECKPRS